MNEEKFIDSMTENVQVRITLGLDDPLDEDLSKVLSIRNQYSDAVDLIAKEYVGYACCLGSEGSYTTFRYLKGQERRMLGIVKYIGDKIIGELGKDYIIYNKIRGWGDEPNWQGEKITELNTRLLAGIRGYADYAIERLAKENDYSL